MSVQYTQYSMPQTTLPYGPPTSQRKNLRVDISRSKQFVMASPLSRELPMPNVSRIYNLSQAHATLLHCSNKLTRSRDSAASSPSSTGTASPSSEDRLDKWLERWEQAFTDYLSNAMPSMGASELAECRVLKANHLACTILASSSGPHAFEAEFQAIIDLAGAVLKARSEANGLASPQFGNRQHQQQQHHQQQHLQQHQHQQPGLAPRRDRQVPSGLDVRDPVILVATRCTGRSIRKRANEILSRYYQ
ncbi:Hypothetical protein R9X50_00176300 [Acrodontium crateriforme]|uniref:Uncharacterized protein n=1 Tax=Acrodontium crateriforme TaxID=150365 RepID=A0AAQ3LZJ9_9PEZI|nr:Hypothetical protein R9X50_00176300 [Acrodontium crateriforme]